MKACVQPRATDCLRVVIASIVLRIQAPPKISLSEAWLIRLE